MARSPQDIQEEQLLWEREIARSTRDYERAVRAGIAPADARTNDRTLYETVRARSRALVAASLGLCEESRAICERSRLVRLTRP